MLTVSTCIVTAGTSKFATRYGPWAIVTGASDGIGRAFAERLAREGLHLVLVARREPALTELANQLRESHGIKCRVIAADLSDLERVHRLAQELDDTDIGLLVAAAGFGTSGPLLSQSIRSETEMVDLNCSSVLVLAWHVGRRMVARGRGGVVFMSSLLAFHGTPLAANYSATKAYVQCLAEGLRVEWARNGVDVIASAPGPVRSGFAARANMQMAVALPPEVVARVTLDALGRGTTVRPGWLSKLLGWSLAMLPRAGRIRVIAKVMHGMTRHQGRTSGGPAA